MLKVFISQKMNGLTTKEIQERRDYILDLFCEEKMIDSFYATTNQGHSICPNCLYKKMKEKNDGK